jgi:hypothetical protein
VHADRIVWRIQVLNKFVEVIMPHPAVDRTVYNKPGQGTIVDFVTVQSVSLHVENWPYIAFSAVAGGRIWHSH